jgi:hypothetical protein
MNHIVLAQKVMEGRGDWLTYTFTPTDLTISSIDAPAVEPLVIRKGGVVVWGPRFLQTGQVGTRQIEVLIRGFLEKAAPARTTEAVNPVTGEVTTKLVSPPYFALRA